MSETLKIRLDSFAAQMAKDAAEQAAILKALEARAQGRAAHLEAIGVPTRLGIRGDSVLFLARELEYVSSRVLVADFRPLKARALLPVNTQIPAGAELFTVRIRESAGASAIVADHATDIPRVSVSRREETQRLRSHALQADWTQQELRAAAMSGEPLPQLKLQAARDGTEFTFNKLALSGDSAWDIVGLFGNTNIPSAAATNGSWVSGSATADEMYEDVMEAINAVITATNGRRTPNLVILPHALLQRLSTVLRPNTDTTALRLLRDANPGVRFEWAPELTSTMWVGVSAPDVVEVLEPEQFTMLPPEVDGLGIKVISTARHGGTAVYEPLAWAKRTGL